MIRVHPHEQPRQVCDSLHKSVGGAFLDTLCCLLARQSVPAYRGDYLERGAVAVSLQIAVAVAFY